MTAQRSPKKKFDFFQSWLKFRERVLAVPQETNLRQQSERVLLNRTYAQLINERKIKQ